MAKGTTGLRENLEASGYQVLEETDPTTKQVTVYYIHERGGRRKMETQAGTRGEAFTKFYRRINLETSFGSESAQSRSPRIPAKAGEAAERESGKYKISQMKYYKSLIYI
ncbi:hypothetical protein PNOK_0265800 [Pyrrhoderma noxium]|uniref:Uncharacterized protein n=1 Tax=Pyrrhoderma noxium TaxID=2282107 RepID=A0A286USZ5_9AGAM|nr:hypothetical protein PNOK_0265800 [Pyrrhoderma noxium]